MHKFKIEQVSPIFTEVWLDSIKLDGVHSVDYRVATNEIPMVTISFFASDVEIKSLEEAASAQDALREIAKSARCWAS